MFEEDSIFIAWAHQQKLQQPLLRKAERARKPNFSFHLLFVFYPNILILFWNIYGCSQMSRIALPPVNIFNHHIPAKALQHNFD